ncbi:hypothetical protein, partial [Nocardia abscessus]|uniref:hypothetical protein n=1 Tax=Nocardia abscessus TaxID=120957 RepID=UPI002456F8F6
RSAAASPAVSALALALMGSVNAVATVAAFGLPANFAVPSVLLYRVLTCWLPVFCGWATMRWMAKKDLI